MGHELDFQPFWQILMQFSLFLMNLLQGILRQTSIVWCRFELWFPKRLSIFFSKRLPFDIKWLNMWKIIHNYIKFFYKSKFDIYFKLFIFYWNAILEKRVFCNWPCNSIFKLHRTLVIHCIYGATHYNFVATIPFQLLCNSLMTTIIMSCWHHFSSIHQNLTHGIMKIFHDLFEILISIVHYDYSF